ncbi:hypothetical protein B296_00028128 [Ensete ventricosum]|uniref:Uncharacterized protein n=1 Tax=Ensete ventricosum TaxID=4639 RepID=A0A427A744_ENSVE|nr:hypothetical protein B296_00028128 [Ensete ventricosum]
MRSECGYVLHWVGAPSYASSVGRRNGTLATLVFHPDGLVDIVNSLWGESPESPHGVYFTCVCWRSVISFPSIFVVSSAGVFNAAGTVGGCPHRGRVCRMLFLPCCHEIFSNPQDLMEIV